MLRSFTGAEWGQVTASGKHEAQWFRDCLHMIDGDSVEVVYVTTMQGKHDTQMVNVIIKQADGTLRKESLMWDETPTSFRHVESISNAVCSEMRQALEYALSA